MPPHTNRDLTFAGPLVRVGRRARLASCRQAVLAALQSIGTKVPNPITAETIHRHLSSSGSVYPLNTVYKTMRRMSDMTDIVEWVGGEFLLRERGLDAERLGMLSPSRVWSTARW